MSWRTTPISRWTDEDLSEFAAFTLPLVRAQSRGIPMGMQWEVLGWLAARYARMFTTAQLADELWEVVQASPQSHGYGPKEGPWRRYQINDIAQRARRFIDREDAAQAELDHQYWVVAQPWLRSLELPPPRPHRERRERRPGVRA
jgi:hypothetical protein